MKFGGDTTFVDLDQGTDRKKTVWGVSAGTLTDGVFGVEADVTYIPGYFEGEQQDVNLVLKNSRVIALMGNVLATIPNAATRGGLRPYFIAGAGLLHVHAEDLLKVTSSNSNVFGINIGGGAMGPITPDSSVRFDLRYFRNIANDPAAPQLTTARPDLSFWRATVGLTLRF